MTPEMMQMANDKVFELLNQQKFNSVEEINDFLNKNISGKNLDAMFFKDNRNKTNSEKSLI